MKDNQNSKVVKSITIEVLCDKDKELNCKTEKDNLKKVNLSTHFNDEETIRILKECLISLEREASQSSTN